jgi:hypothetical protein
MSTIPIEFFDQIVFDRGGLAAVLQTPYRPHVSILDLIQDPDPWPHLVHYQKNRVIYVPPDEFLCWKPTKPSDCTWIVPGTGEAK